MSSPERTRLVLTNYPSSFEMEKTESPPSDSKTAAQLPQSDSKTAAQSPPSDSKTAAQSPQSDSKTAAQSPPSDSKTAAQSPPFDCHQASDHDQFASSFTSLYHSIFPPKPSQLPNSLSFTPSTTASPSSSSAADEISTENRLRQARLILEYQDLCEHYNLSLARLQTLTNELELIRRENADLRVANSELVKLISLSSESVMQHQNRTFGNNRDGAFERRNNANNVERERVTLPKSISVRSSGFVKVNQAVSGNVSNNGGGRGSASGNSTRSRVASHLDQLVSGSMQQRVYVPGGGKKRSEEEIAAGMELEVFNQGMWKTELCNKWQETGTCPYGNHCQFAHGIGELRPVIRHPRYKTQACRMVLAGGVCPYGHRCHFRHSLTDQDRKLLKWGLEVLFMSNQPPT